MERTRRGRRCGAEQVEGREGRERGWGSMLMPVYGEISHRDPIIVSLPCSFSTYGETLLLYYKLLHSAVRSKHRLTDVLSFLSTETCVIFFFFFQMLQICNSDFLFTSFLPPPQLILLHLLRLLYFLALKACVIDMHLT